MKAPAKIGLVFAGYVAAVLVAYGVLAIYTAATSGPDRQTYGGMYAFGDGLLFLAVFGAAAVPATGAGLYFMRPHRTFWLVLRVLALAVAGTAVAAVLAFVAGRGGKPSADHM